MSAEKLYTPALLAAAVELANYPPLEHAKFEGSSRSPTCGSTIETTIDCDAHGALRKVGMRVHACAVGQAAAAVFARHAAGRSVNDVSRTRNALSNWLAGKGGKPDWPDIDLIAPAAAFPARHGAMLLPWDAALDALSSQMASG